MAQKRIFKVREILSVLEREGWRRVGGEQSADWQFVHPNHPGRATLSVHSKNADIPIGTLKSIEKQSGIKFRYALTKKKRNNRC